MACVFSFLLCGVFFLDKVPVYLLPLGAAIAQVMCVVLPP